MAAGGVVGPVGAEICMQRSISIRACLCSPQLFAVGLHRWTSPTDKAAAETTAAATVSNNRLEATMYNSVL